MNDPTNHGELRDGKLCPRNWNAALPSPSIPVDAKTSSPGEPAPQTYTLNHAYQVLTRRVRVGQKDSAAALTKLHIHQSLTPDDSPSARLLPYHPNIRRSTGEDASQRVTDNQCRIRAPAGDTGRRLDVNQK